MNNDFRERFLRANANREYICSEFTEVLRDLIRGVAVISDPARPVSRAAKNMHFVLDLLSYSEEKIGFYDLFSEAVRRLRQYEAESLVEETMYEAARAGVSMLMEATCADNAARGRVSQRQHDFLHHIKWIDEARSEQRSNRAL